MNKIKITTYPASTITRVILWRGINLFSVLALFIFSIQAVQAGEAVGTIGGDTEVGEPAPDAPDAPTNLSATANGTSQIDLSWSAVADVDGYEIYRDGSSIATVTGTIYSNTGLSSGTTYSYKVKAYIGSVKSEFSGSASATTEVATTGGGGGGGGGGGSAPPPSTPSAPEPEPEPESESEPDTIGETGDVSGEVLGVKIESPREAQVNQILSDAGDVFGGDVSKVLANSGESRDLRSEADGATKYTTPLIQGITGLTAENTNAVTNFVVYGTASTGVLGAGERAGVLNSYKSAFGKLPTAETEWSDAIKIANGRWPSETSETAENNATAAFKKIYLRDPDRSNPNDDAAVTVMAYGLRPSDRNLDSEKAAIRIFKDIYKYIPTSATDWDAVRAIAYSGATR